jgi:HlyD family secretion protein
MDHARPRSKAEAIKRIAALTAPAIILAGGGLAFANIDFTSERVDREELTIETVQRGTLEIKVSANGQLLPKNIEYLASQVIGRVAKVHVKPGDVVEEGQLLADLTNPQLIAGAEEAHSAWEGAVRELEASEAELQINELNQEVVLTQAFFGLSHAELQLEAETKLLSQQAIPEMDFKRRKLEVAQLTKTHALEERRLERISNNIKVQLAVRKSRITQLARALDRAKDQTASLKIIAGIRGTVQTMEIDVGQQLQPGSPIGRIAQHDQLYAELKVPAREAAEVEPGQQVVVDTRGGTVDGVVTRVDPAVTDGTVIVDVDLKSALPAGARPQLPVEGIVYLSRLANTLYVGKPSYVKSNGVMTVYQLDAAGRYATRVTIKAGKLSINYLQILEGLEEGDRIITSELGEWKHEERVLIN